MKVFWKRFSLRKIQLSKQSYEMNSIVKQMKLFEILINKSLVCHVYNNNKDFR